MKILAICQNTEMWNHEGDPRPEVIEYCQNNNIAHVILDPYSPDIIENLNQCTHLIWPIQNYLWADLLEGRNILKIAENKGIKVFPDQHTIWHFDDKIAEMYALQAINAPIPKSWVFYSLSETKKFLEHSANYPLVAKLRCGSGASNVKLLKNKGQAIKYAKRMFGKGFDPSPSLLYKAYSKAQSSRNWKTFWSRLKKLPTFLYTRSRAKQMPIEKGYCYFQEFIPNDGYDLKVVVIGDKMSFIARNTRKGDFRASGGGDCYYDKSLVTQNIIDSAFHVADKLKTQCMGFDYVVDQRTGQGLIVEMCYGFDHKTLQESKGYFNRSGIWVEQPLDVIAENIQRLIHE